MSSTVPSLGNFQDDLNASSTAEDVDGEHFVHHADSEDDLILDGSDLLDADPLGEVDNTANEPCASLPS